MLGLFKSRKKKKYEKDVNIFFNQVRRSIELYREEYDSYKTMEIVDFKNSHTIYLETVDYANKILREKSDLSEFNNILKPKWRELLKQHLIRIFQVSDSCYECVKDGANGPEDLKKVLLNNEDKFKEEVQKAVAYFGEGFLKEKIWRNPGNKTSCINAMNGSVTVEEMLKKGNCAKIVIEDGKPIPYYHSIYNNNLKYIVDKYFDMLENNDDRALYWELFIHNSHLLVTYKSV